MYNLHLHTNYSDGVLSPQELLKKLEDNNIKIAAITDHDNVDAHFVLRKIKYDEYFTGYLIPGSTEMKCTHNGFSIEILGYFINIEMLKPYLDKKEEKLNEFQKFAYEEGKKVCKKLNLKFDDIKLTPGQFAGTAMYNLLNKYYDENVKILGKGYIENGSVFYRKTFVNPESPFYVPEENLGYTAKDTIDIIHKAGGLAFLAHIGQYKMIKDKLLFLKNLKDSTELDGIECYYSLHSDEETREYLNFCKENNLLISGGSDFHGIFSQNIITQNNINSKDLFWINEFKDKLIREKISNN